MLDDNDDVHIKLSTELTAKTLFCGREVISFNNTFTLPFYKCFLRAHLLETLTVATFDLVLPASLDCSKFVTLVIC